MYFSVVKEPLPILFVFVDGLGLGSNDPGGNPLADHERFPMIGKILEQSIPLDAALGVPGLPQSATGQAALLTGLNAPQLMGRHIEGFPPPRLKALVQEHNIFSKLLKAGKTCTFANAYWLDDVAHISAFAALRRDRPPRRESVTTVATLAAFGGVRGKADLLANRAVYQDLTREKLRTRGYDRPLITPEEAAQHLIGIANDHDFTLFEFFETDHAGHSGDREQMNRTLKKLDCFLGALEPFKGVLLITSDHGNIEDVTARGHTANPVPLFASDPRPFQKLQNIAELTPSVLRQLQCKG
jgi:hypothetical protein